MGLFKYLLGLGIPGIFSPSSSLADIVASIRKDSKNEEELPIEGQDAEKAQKE